MFAFTYILLTALMIYESALGCSIQLGSSIIFGNEPLSLGPNEGEWIVTVDGSRELRFVLEGEPVDTRPTSGEFVFDANSGASFPVDNFPEATLARREALRPDFSGQYKVEFLKNMYDFRVFYPEGDFIGVDEPDEFRLPWVSRQDRSGDIVTKTPYSVAYWSSVSRKQVYVLVEVDEFEPIELHILDLEDGSWLEYVVFSANYERRRDGKWIQLKSLDEFGIIETSVPCCACTTFEWASFDADGNTRAITRDSLYGDWGFDHEGNLLKSEFEKLYIFRSPDYEQEVVEFTADSFRDTLDGPVKCAKADCPGFPKPQHCGFDDTKPIFGGVRRIRVKGKFSSCGCKKICADRDTEFWALKVSSGRCMCYSGGRLKRAIPSTGYISSHERFITG